MNQRYAGFGVRFVAALVDGVLLFIVSFIIGLPVGLVFGDNASSVASILGWAISISYYVVYQQKYGQTIGKKAMKIKVVNAEGKTPTMFTFFLREIIGKVISGLILLIGYLMVIWDAKKQALHDKIANTYVVYVEPGVQTQNTPTQQQTAQLPQQPALGVKV